MGGGSVPFLFFHDASPLPSLLPVCLESWPRLDPTSSFASELKIGERRGPLIPYLMDLRWVLESRSPWDKGSLLPLVELFLQIFFVKAQLGVGRLGVGCSSLTWESPWKRRQELQTIVCLGLEAKNPPACLLAGAESPNSCFTALEFELIIFPFQPESPPFNPLWQFTL